MEPAVDGGQTKLDVVVRQQLLTDLLATPAELVADVDDLLDGGLWGTGLWATLLAGMLVFQELTDTGSFDACEPPVHCCSVLTYYLADLNYG